MVKWIAALVELLGHPIFISFFINFLTLNLNKAYTEALVPKVNGHCVVDIWVQKPTLAMLALQQEQSLTSE